VSPAHLRGGFIMMNQVAYNVGTFLGQIIGVYIPYYWLAVIPLLITLSLEMLSMTIKETPRWLMSRGKKNEAERVLRWLRGPDYDVTQEIQDIENVMLSRTKLTLLEVIREFSKRSIYYPVILACILSSFVQFSGVTAITFHAEDIFKQANVKSPGLISSISTSGTQIVAALIGGCFVDTVGRRKLIIFSGIVMCLSQGAMGAYEYLNNKPYCHPPDDPRCKDHLWPLAIASIVCFMASFAGGMLATSWMIITELIPLRIRGVGIGITTLVIWVSILIIAGLFNSYEAAIRPWGVFWGFSLMCLFSVMFVAVFIPETKGRTLEDIEVSLKVG